MCLPSSFHRPDATRRLTLCWALRVAAQCSIENLAAAAAADPVSCVQQFEPADDVFPIDNQTTWSLQYLSVSIFGQRENTELRQYVKKHFNATHIETALSLTSVESVSVPFILGTASSCGPLVKGKESTMNPTTMFSALVNNR